MLTAGESFPDFSLYDQSGKTVTLNDLKGSKTIVYFYPKDDTPGCTTEACDFRDRQAQLGGVKVIGVSPDTVDSHKKFIEKHGLNFPLLADPNKDLINAVGAWGEKMMYGKPVVGLKRSTFILDEDGKIVKVWPNVKATGHADQVLKALK